MLPRRIPAQPSFSTSTELVLSCSFSRTSRTHTAKMSKEAVLRWRQASTQIKIGDCPTAYCFLNERRHSSRLLLTKKRHYRHALKKTSFWQQATRARPRWSLVCLPTPSSIRAQQKKDLWRESIWSWATWVINRTTWALSPIQTRLYTWPKGPH